MRAFSIFALMLCGYTLYAQEHSINGIVKDNDGAAIVAATVSLLNATDSSWVQSELTGDKGEFLFKEIKEGKYLIDVSAMGYQKWLKSVEKSNAIEIVLTKNATELKEVVIKSKAPTIQTGLGKTTINFEQAAISAGSNVIDLLRKTPGVTVDGNGNVSMNGKGVLIMIDGKQIYFSGEDLNNYLRSLPAEQVALLDLMSQPSAKYDAEGNTGIINIQTRKSKKPGMSGSVTVSYGQGVYPVTHNSANANYKKDKLTLSANAGYLHATGFLDQTVDRTVSDRQTGVFKSHTDEHTFMRETFEDYSLRLQGSYDISNKTTVGASVQGIYHPNTQKDVTQSTIEDLQTGNKIYSEAINDHGFSRNKVNSNVNLSYKPSIGHEVSGDIDYLSFRSTEHMRLSTQNYDVQKQEEPGGIDVKGETPMVMNVYVGKADYTGSFKNDLKLEAGVKSSVVNNSNETNASILVNENWTADTTRSFDYLYNENINAAYINASRSIGKKWQAQLGLRMENTNIEGAENVRGKRFSRSFTNLFPTAFVSYKLNDKNTFEVNCGRRINRPSYRDLNPFVVYLNQYSSSSGNPELLPQLRTMLALKHSYNNMLFSELSYSKVYNTINEITLYNALTNAVHTMERNVANKHNMHFSVSLSKEIQPWWSLMSSYDWYYNEYEDFEGNYLVSSHGHSFGLQNQFSYKGWSVDTAFYYNSGDLQSISERNGQSSWMNASVAKKLWKDSATIKLSVEDPFDLYRYTPTRNWEGVASTANMRFQSQMMSLSFTYNLGKSIENMRQRNSNSEESGRM